MKRADEIVPSTPTEEVALRFFTTLMKKDLSAFAALWADDAVVEIPFPPELEGFEPIWRGKERIMANYNSVIPGRRDHVFWVHDVHQTSDPGCVIIEASAHSILGSNGRSYDQRYINLFRVRDGKIVLFREYINPLVFMRAFGP